MTLEYALLSLRADYVAATIDAHFQTDHAEEFLRIHAWGLTEVMLDAMINVAVKAGMDPLSFDFEKDPLYQAGKQAVIARFNKHAIN